jgi:predicted negative regulator of RcsB-dependent stress response
VAKRYTRKELKREDEFVTFWHHVYEWMRGSTQPILIGLAVAAVVILGSSLWTNHKDKREAEATRMLSQAMRIYSTDLTSDEEMGKKLTAEDGVPRFKTAEDRRKTTLEELGQIQSKFGATGAAREAQLVRAGVLFDGGLYDDAISAYGDFLAATESDNKMRMLAREGRGYALEAKGQLDPALDEYRKLETEGADVYKDRAQYHEARIFEKKGDKAGAEKLYKAILEKNPQTALRDDISNRLAALGAK